MASLTKLLNAGGFFFSFTYDVTSTQVQQAQKVGWQAATAARLLLRNCSRICTFGALMLQSLTPNPHPYL